MKFKNMLQKVKHAGAVVSVAVLSAAPMYARAEDAQALGSDFSQLTKAISLGDIIAVLMGVGSLFAGVYVTMKGIGLVIRLIRGN
ncbi:hypothetical protein [Pandoraea sp.]|uniref:hypothetical protein n=1 Tax=Pandoraea sp. TaxID=1883445 RepID=UPI0035B4426B